jgi:carbonic anhydrase
VVEVPYEPGSYVSIGHSVTDAYFLSQFHFHVRCEHALNGQRYGGEMHLVLTNRLGETLVIGVLLSISPAAQAGALDDIVLNAPMAVANNTVSGTVNVMGPASCGKPVLHLHRLPYDAVRKAYAGW